MSAQPKVIYGEDNTVHIDDALNYAIDTKADIGTVGAVTDADVYAALKALADDPVWIACIKRDYRADKLADMGRLLDMQISVARAPRLQQAMP